MTNHPKPTDEKQLNFNESNIDFLYGRAAIFVPNFFVGRTKRSVLHRFWVLL